MAVVGCLGEIVFQVSSEKVETVSNMEWSGSARYAVHERHGMDALTEYTGKDPDKFSFDLTLVRQLGVDVQKELVKLWDYERTGQAVPLVLGEKAYGKYRWNVISHTTKMEQTDPNGNVILAIVSVELQEYLR